MESGRVRLFGVVPLKPVLAWLGAFVVALLIALWMARPAADQWPWDLWIRDSDIAASNIRFFDSPGGSPVPTDVRSMSASSSSRDGVLEEYELEVGVATPGAGGLTFSFGPEAWFVTTGETVRDPTETWRKLVRTSRR